MRLVLNDSKFTFTVTKAAEPKTEFGSEQQKSEPGEQAARVGRGGPGDGLRARGGDPGHGDW